MTEPSEAPADVERAFEVAAYDAWWSEHRLRPFKGRESDCTYAWHAGFAASAAERERLRGALEDAVQSVEAYGQPAFMGAMRVYCPQIGVGQVKGWRAALSSGQGEEKRDG